MQINIIMQKENENTIASAISECLENNAKKAYFFVGNFKETGYKIIEEDLIDIKTKLFFAIGVDKKTTTKSMLDGLLNYTDDVYFYSNNGLSEFVSNIIAFEYTDKAIVYVSTSNISESGIMTDLALYTKIVYDLKDAEDKAAYKDQMKDLLKLVENDGFKKLTKAAINQLVEDKEIFSTRQYNHQVMSISELLGKKEKVKEEPKQLSKEEIDDVYATKDVEIPKIDLSDISIDIDIPEEEIAVPEKDEFAIDYEEEKITLPKDIEGYEETEEVEEKVEKSEEPDKESELYDESLVNEDLDMDATLDINSMLFSKADVKLDLTEDKKTKKKTTTTKKAKVKEEVEEEKSNVKVKSVNLNNISTLIFEVSSKNAKEADSLRVPNHVKLMIPEFFGLDDAQNEEINGSLVKAKHIKLEIVDVKNNAKYEDDDALMTYKAKQSYLTFASSKLNEIHYNEDDIVRIVKVNENEYQMEIVDKDLQEYKLWSKLCNQTFRASTKKFGMM